jgi:diaminohydroxyphosphoribosylaminopyrimidine deaminase/5-amino-6-(5-phosphoribosylamino)uracil reductase
MRQALMLAALGKNLIGDGPMVGAVYVKNQHIITKGFHQQQYGLHAEFDAFKNQDYDVNGATLYVTLEPCAHDDYFPSCAQFVIRKGIKKVYIASLDPNPIENGDGVRLLEDAGIEVITGLMDEDNRVLNERYFERFK